MYDPVVEQLVSSLRNLPTIGQRSARRIAMQLCHDKAILQRLIEQFQCAEQQVKPCQQCRNFVSTPLCAICTDARRQTSLLCVVSQPQDVLAIEASGAFIGHYFVLHGLLSPLDGIGAEQLGIPQLEQRLAYVEEMVLALPYTVEGEATASLLLDKAAEYQISVSKPAQGMPSGSEVASMDNATLSLALQQRQSLHL